VQISFLLSITFWPLLNSSVTTILIEKKEAKIGSAAGAGGAGDAATSPSKFFGAKFGQI